ncbi:TetR/AcrR family transcriptional regulator [Streptomyces albireticuli]|uniref:TetR family transcriptional regulator n=1 Tax=Streptomyces albireticuli TaxID=1940 RepID=A0A2A2D6S8_9ACTN|nr:TetR/AcrR family transcriptional regulator [Streptomyces albireticuli]MCD9195145.1 TetR/AcrR family transcriptional regulator [Streptomyces albireticuli]PAU47040.1 TetR family transcriptional regulator [Streptomyces albireticuli]
MPRQVDYDSRRRRIVAAAFALVSEEGLEGMTVRDVAARAGVSVGAVQRCFPSKEEMMASVVEDMNARVSARVQGRIADSADPGSATTMLRHTLAGILPHDEPTLAESRAWLAFAAHAAVTPALAAVQREQYDGLAELVALLLRTAQASGDVRPGTDTDGEADALIALADGLGMQVLMGRRTPGEALATLDRRLAALRTAR